jgi:hypothetical protein
MSVYIVTDGTNFKIGYTNEDIQCRINNLQTGNPKRLTIVHAMDGGRPLEKLLHKIFDSKRLSGEWFNLSEDDLKIIKEWVCPHCGAQKHTLLQEQAKPAKPTVSEEIKGMLVFSESKSKKEMIVGEWFITVDKLKKEVDRLGKRCEQQSSQKINQMLVDLGLFQDRIYVLGKQSRAWIGAKLIVEQP